MKSAVRMMLITVSHENQKQLFLLFSQLISHSEIVLPHTGRQTIPRRTAHFYCCINYSKCLLHKRINHSQLERLEAECFSGDTDLTKSITDGKPVGSRNNRIILRRSRQFSLLPGLADAQQGQPVDKKH